MFEFICGEWSLTRFPLPERLPQPKSVGVAGPFLGIDALCTSSPCSPTRYTWSPSTSILYTGSTRTSGAVFGRASPQPGCSLQFAKTKAGVSLPWLKKSPDASFRVTKHLFQVRLPQLEAVPARRHSTSVVGWFPASRRRGSRLDAGIARDGLAVALQEYDCPLGSTGAFFRGVFTFLVMSSSKVRFVVLASAVASISRGRPCPDFGATLPRPCPDH